MHIVDVIYDQRSTCFSILAKISLEEYRKIAYPSFEQGGNISGQRDVIKRSSVATKIRKRMNDDFIAGAVFPYVVVGILVDQERLYRIESAIEGKDFSCINNIIEATPQDDISIIDGMQRSNIYFNNFTGNETRQIRVEFWVSTQSVKLLYRMLVLNTGQVPWNTRRQIEVVYSNLSKTIITDLHSRYSSFENRIEFISVDDSKRRTQAGKFHKSAIIEMYLGFNTRNVKVDVNDELADEFQRFDMIESIDHDKNFALFVDTIAYLLKLDIAFSNFELNEAEGQFHNGKDIFGSNPACLGFAVACAEFIIGKFTVEREETVKAERNIELSRKIDEFVQLLDEKKDSDFLALSSLSEVTAQLPKLRIGDEMRTTFKNIFSEIIKYDDIKEITSMEAFWRS